MAISIQQLIQGQPPLVTVDLNDSLSTALALMIDKDFSQLPVLENGRPYGNGGSLITSDSIVRALKVFSSDLEGLRVRDALVAARTIAADDDLFSKIDALFDAYALLVADAQGNLVGIVTNYDTAQYFRRRALDMLLAENIETTLKGHLREAYRGADENDDPLHRAVNNLTTHEAQNREECKKALYNYGQRKKVAPDNDNISAVLDRHFPEPKEVGDFDKLTLDQYIALARTPEAWNVLGPIFGISTEKFATMMDGARRTRNKLMHFNPNVSAQERGALRFCSNWFDNHPFDATSNDEAKVIAEIIRTTQSSHIVLTPGMVVPADTSPEEEPKPEADAAPEEPTAEEVSLIEDEDASAERLSESVEAKYAPLANFLWKQAKTLERLPLSFEAIERIIAAPLPDAARENRSWWDNNPQSRVQSGQWLKVNWRVVSVNMTTQRVTFGRAHERAKTYIEFFSGVQALFREQPLFPLFDANPLGINWLPLYKFECPYPLKPTILLSFAHHHRLRLELYLDCGDADLNREIFRRLQKGAQTLENALGAALSWEELEAKRACRVAIYTSGGIDDDPDAKTKLTKWAVQSAIRFYDVFAPPLQSVLDSPGSKPAELQLSTLIPHRNPPAAS